MADYTQITDFSAKDALSAGDPNKLIVGADFDAEWDAEHAKQRPIPAGAVAQRWVWVLGWGVDAGAGEGAPVVDGELGSEEGVAEFFEVGFEVWGPVAVGSAERAVKAKKDHFGLL